MVMESAQVTKKNVSYQDAVRREQPSIEKERETSEENTTQGTLRNEKV